MPRANMILTEETLSELDKFAESLGISRSKAAEMILSGTLGTAPDGVVGVLRSFFGAGWEKTRSKRKNGLEGATDAQTVA
jgi:hypothetical protein